MQNAIMILGILGGIIGLASVGFSWLFGGFETYNGATVVCSLLFGDVRQIFTSAHLENFLPIFCPIGAVFAIMGIVGGSIAKAKIKIAAVLMATSAVGGILFISLPYILAAIMLSIGSVLAWMEYKKIRSNDTKWYKDKVIMAPVAFFLAFILVGFGLSIKTKLFPPSSEYQVSVPNVGVVNGMMFDEVGYAVISVEEKKSIWMQKLGKKMDAKGKYLITKISIENKKSIPIQIQQGLIVTRSFELITGQGKAYSHEEAFNIVGDIEKSLKEQYQCDLLKDATIKPGETRVVLAVFDVPAEEKEFKLQIFNERTNEKKLMPFTVPTQEMAKTEVQPVSNSPQTSPGANEAKQHPALKIPRGVWQSRSNGPESLHLECDYDEMSLSGTATGSTNSGKRLDRAKIHAPKGTNVVKWTSSFGGTGTASIEILNEYKIRWTILRAEGMNYLPKSIVLELQ
ncbi:MAG: DUF4352 domain-containing protein [Negativicutes bacterium]|nr:DUF4352 domain-containing protein [Negativicutes bacterium]